MVRLSHPLFAGGIIPRLQSKLGVPILNLSDAGDEVRFMLGVEQRILLAQHLADGCPAGGPWDALLFSGGGNDIADNPMALWIRDWDPALPPAALIHQPRFGMALALVRAGYEDLIALRDQLSPGTHLVFHGYDFAIPDGRGVCGFGPWLKPTFDLRKFPPAIAPRQAVVKEMLLQFAAMLESLVTPTNKVTVIKTQGTLPANRRAPGTTSFTRRRRDSRSSPTSSTRSSRRSSRTGSPEADSSLRGTTAAAPLAGCLGPRHAIADTRARIHRKPRACPLPTRSPSRPTAPTGTSRSGTSPTSIPSRDSPELQAALSRADAASLAFAEKWKGKLAEIAGGPEAGAKLAEAVRAYEALEDLLGRIISYAGLLYAGDTTDPARAKFYGDVQEKITAASLASAVLHARAQPHRRRRARGGDGATRRSATTGRGSRTSARRSPTSSRTGSSSSSTRSR